jgi:hypothetical protein
MTADRFWKHVDKTDECWTWKLKLNRDGYGSITVAGKNILAHRYSVMLDGRDPIGKVVMHKCDNPACVRPDHLEVATQQDNIKDMHVKGRYRHVQSSLTEAQVREIRNASGSVNEIGKLYGISGTYAWHIRKGNARKDVI